MGTYKTERNYALWALWQSGLSYAELGRRFGITRACASKLARHEGYRRADREKVHLEAMLHPAVVAWGEAGGFEALEDLGTP
jgi:hypothetical protein